MPRPLTREWVQGLVNTDSPDSLAAKARATRWNEFERVFPDVDEMRVLDLGGTPRFWRAAPVRPAEVTIVNFIAEEIEEPWMKTVVTDACQPELDGAFDLVVSNSLIEHVGGHARRSQLAEVVRERAPHHWIQTPNRNFPIEPHWLFPGAQYLPVKTRAQLSLHWKYGHMQASTPEEALAQSREVQLLDQHQMQALFTDSRIWHEKFAGLTKSLVAIL
jgi:hypothetical protein